MRALFCMLFGAGVILFTSRAERSGSRNTADIFARRNLWLMLFGLLHGCLIWDGDILFDYAFVALLFLYPFRRLSARKLIWIGSLLALFLSPLNTEIFEHTYRDILLHYRMTQAQSVQKDHLPLSPAQQAAVSDWHTRVQDMTPSPAKTSEAIKRAKAPYRIAVLERTQFDLWSGFAALRLSSVADFLPPMLLSCGLLKIGFFSLELETSTYLSIALLGFAISLPLYTVGVLKTYNSHLFFLNAQLWLFGPAFITRVPGSLAVAATLLLAIRFRIALFLQHALAAVGRTAFSNYILTSLLCQTIFVWGPYPLFGKLDFYQLMLTAIAVWVVNLIVSVLWLRAFAFGPLEWLWRSLTYWKPQPMLLKNTAR